MKNLTIIIFILSILFTQSSFAAITGKINERVDNKLIVEFFENYTHFKINNNDDRIIEIYSNDKLQGLVVYHYYIFQ